MIESLARFPGRTLLPILGTIAALAASGATSIGAGGEAGGSASAAVGRMDAPPAGTTVVHVRHRTEYQGASGSFSPDTVVVRRGDVVRFATDGLAPHNVSFMQADNPGVSFLPPAGPYLISKDQSYKLRVDLEPGVYRFQCDPHAPMGEQGVLVVMEAMDPPAPVIRETR